MGKIEDLYVYFKDNYDPHMNALLGTSKIITAITTATQQNGYTQIQAQPALSGEYISTSQVPSGVSHWIWEAEAQHAAYASLLLVTGLPSTSPLPAIVAVPQKASGGAA